MLYSDESHRVFEGVPIRKIYKLGQPSSFGWIIICLLSIWITIIVLAIQWMVS